MATDRLQGLNIGTAWKPPCYVASTANLTLSSTQVVDGIAVGSCERILAKDQTDAKLNGVYIADSASWRRAPDWDGSRDAIPGTAVYVDRGAAGGGKAYIANSSATATRIDIASTGDDVSFDLMTLALAGVSAFSQDTLLPLTTAAAWRSSDGLTARGSTITIDSTDISSSAITTALIAGSAVTTAKIADDAVTLAKMSTGVAGNLITYSTLGDPAAVATGSTGQVLTSNGAGLAPTMQDGGTVVQSAIASTAAYASFTATIPFDDTIPQNTEGTEILTATITPKRAGSILRVRVLAPVSTSGSAIGPTLALFRDSSAGAVDAFTLSQTGAGATDKIQMLHEEAAGSTAATTFKLRFGPHTTGTAYINGNNIARKFGGITSVTLVIDERTA